ncbi:MAG: suppressor of fused domain protein [Spirochaetes bacterium]|nr:suppressor of fused domain protein [Spirochaetota bacterium]
MIKFIKNLFSKKPKFTDDDYEQHYEKKSKSLENLLGELHELVGHAIVPFQIGGAVDMYYFLKSKYGTAFATMELIEPDGSGPKPNNNGKTYELVGFTKQKYSENKESDFSKIERRICGIFTTIGNYSYQAVLNPKETCEIPNEDNTTNCLIFDEYTDNENKFIIDDHEHSLLICIEVFKNEMDYAMEYGTDKLISKLKEKKIYPYSDLDRESVV